jgi:Flp pilus assembly protein TadG
MNRLRHRARQQRGSATVELAVALPLLIAVIVGTVDFARVFYWEMALTTAARAGAQWGAQSTTNAADIATMKSTALAAASTDIPSLALSDITATCTLQCVPDSPGTVSYTTTTPSPSSSCSATSPACTSGSHLAWLVTVGATKTFTTLGYYPGIPSSVPMTRSATMRAQ